MIVFGLFSCILGNILFKFEVFILCIFMVTILIFVFSQYIFPSGIANWIIWIMLVIGLLLGSTAGFFAFKYYIRIGTLLAGGICGFFLGQFLYNLFDNRIVVNGIIINIIFVVVAIGAMIFICFCYKKMSIIISTSFIGSYIFIRGISLLAGGFPSVIQIMDLNREGETEQIKDLLTWRIYIYIVFIAIATLLSIFGQIKLNKEYDDDDDEDEKYLYLKYEEGDKKESKVQHQKNKEKEEKKEKKSKNKNLLLVIFKTTAQYTIEISIDPNKKMKELIRQYFKKINREDLYGDDSIRFFKNANFFTHDSNDLILPYFEGKNEGNIITVDDLENKIQVK